MPVHVSGRSCDMKKIMTLAKKYNFTLLKMQQRLSVKKNGKFLGTIGDIGCFSLSPNKILLQVKEVFLLLIIKNITKDKSI